MKQFLVLLLFVSIFFSSCRKEYDYNWEENVRIPTMLSPENYGICECWKVEADGVLEAELIITDQYHVEIWHAYSIYDVWCPDWDETSGIYHYFVHLKFVDDTERDYHGDIYLME